MTVAASAAAVPSGLVLPSRGAAGTSVITPCATRDRVPGDIVEAPDQAFSLLKPSRLPRPWRRESRGLKLKEWATPIEITVRIKVRQFDGGAPELP